MAIYNIGFWQSRQIFHLTQTKLILQDLVLELDEMTVLQNSSVFDVKPGSFAPFYLEKDLI